MREKEAKRTSGLLPVSEHIEGAGDAARENGMLALDSELMRREWEYDGRGRERGSLILTWRPRFRVSGEVEKHAASEGGIGIGIDDGDDRLRLDDAKCS